eukprot:Lankesteria_metandrocarpae@DN3121_c0_g1_i1.p1
MLSAVVSLLRGKESALPKHVENAIKTLDAEALRLIDAKTKPGGVGVPIGTVRSREKLPEEVVEHVPGGVPTVTETQQWQQRNIIIERALDEVTDYVKQKVSVIERYRQNTNFKCQSGFGLMARSSFDMANLSPDQDADGFVGGDDTPRALYKDQRAAEGVGDTAKGNEIVAGDAAAAAIHFWSKDERSKSGNKPYMAADQNANTGALERDKYVGGDDDDTAAALTQTMVECEELAKLVLSEERPQTGRSSTATDRGSSRRIATADAAVLKLNDNWGGNQNESVRLLTFSERLSTDTRGGLLNSLLRSLEHLNLANRLKVATLFSQLLLVPSAAGFSESSDGSRSRGGVMVQLHGSYNAKGDHCTESEKLATTLETVQSDRPYKYKSSRSLMTVYLLRNPSTIKILLEGLKNPHIAFICCSILRIFFRFSTIPWTVPTSSNNKGTANTADVEHCTSTPSKIETCELALHILEKCDPKFIMILIQRASTTAFGVMTQVLDLLREVLLSKNTAVQDILLQQHCSIFEAYRNMLLESSNSYTCRRLGGKALYDVLSDPIRSRLMGRFVGDPKNLDCVVAMVESESDIAVAIEGFHLLKLFVFDPKMSIKIKSSLSARRNALLLQIRNIIRNCRARRAVDSMFETDAQMTITKLLQLDCPTRSSGRTKSTTSRRHSNNSQSAATTSLSATTCVVE